MEDINEQLNILEEQLEIAKEALTEIQALDFSMHAANLAQFALEEIEVLDK